MRANRNCFVANSRAVAFPIPDEAPVMIATREAAILTVNSVNIQINIKIVKFIDLLQSKSQTDKKRISLAKESKLTITVDLVHYSGIPKKFRLSALLRIYGIYFYLETSRIKKNILCIFHSHNSI